MRLTWISRGWENVERHWSKDVAPMDGAYFSRTFAVLGMLKISTIGSCHANPDGNVARAPVGADRAEPDDRLRRQPLGGMTIVRPRHVQELHRLTLASAGLLAGFTVNGPT